MIYLIGGSPRGGKSILANMISQKLNIPYFIREGEKYGFQCINTEDDFYNKLKETLNNFI